MFIDNTGIDLFDQNVGMACANVRLRLIYLIKLGISCVEIRLRCSSVGIDLFDQNMSYGMCQC